MFGSLRIERRRLAPEQLDLYRAHFCAACHALREQGGRLDALSTNYEQTVLALVLGGLADHEDIRVAACTAMPLRRVQIQPLDAASRAYLAALNIAVVEQKLLDDIGDEGRWWTGVLHRLGRRRFGRARQRLAETQGEVERRATGTLQDYAAPSAALSGLVFGFAATLMGHGELRASLEAFGRELGFLVYGWDAWQDREEDLRRGRFNPIGRDPDPRADSYAELDESLLRLGGLLEALSLGAQGEILAQLILSMQHRLHRHRPAWSAEAGECDAACCAADCCDGASICDACTCCDVCTWGQTRQNRRQRREARRRSKN